MNVFLVLAAFLAVSFAFPIQYEMFEGHQVLRIVPQTKEQLEHLLAIESSGILVDFWIEPRQVGKAAHLRVTPQQHDDVLAYLKKHEMEHTIYIENLRTLVERESKELAERVPFNAGDDPSKITLNQYHTLADILAYMNSVATANPTLASIVNIGMSYQKQALTAIKIGNPGTNKPAVWIDGGIHAREWITTATVLYIINELTTKQSQYSKLLSTIDVYLMPVVNADGYTYTFTNDRMWRKTRSGPRSGCYGVDPNRNWNFKWGVAGSSNNPCSETYDGPSPFSEVEPKQVADFLTANKANLKAYFNLHSYSEDWMYPFGWAAHTYPADVNKLKAISAQAVAAIQAVNGEKFQYGSITDIVYPASGSTIDFTNAVLGIDYSFGMELRPNGDASNGFVLPPSQIIAGASETWAGLQVVLNAVANGQ
uniref:Zinc carboxypeptidase A 1 n=1 Tax=Plectus sambesii TaxID=2011161 RepID=A0A914VI35_9BILA